MSVVGEATVVVKADGSRFGAEAGKQIEDGLNPVVKRIGTVLAGAFVGKKIFDGIKGGIAELKESQVVVAQTEAAIKSTGGAAGVTAGQIGDLATAQSKLTGIDDELIQKGSNLLLTFTNVHNAVGAGNDIFNQATIAAEDLSTAGFGSMESASVLLGKALNDPIKGLTALQRVGVSLTDSQKEAVKQFVATGDTLSAQKVILGEIERQVGGSAAAFGETLPGQLAKAKNASDEMKAALVGGMAPALVSVSGLVTGAAEAVAELPGPLRTAIGGALGLAAGFFAIARPVNEGLKLLQMLKPAHEAAAAAATVQTGAEERLAIANAEANASSGKLASVLGTAGVVAGAGLAIGALYLYGQSLNKTTASTEDVIAATKLSADQSVVLLDRLHSISKGAFSGEFQSYIDGLVAQGDAGIGVLRTYRQHLVDVGQSTDQVDAALKSAADSQANLNANQAVGSDTSEETAKQLDAAGKAAENYSGFLTDLSKAMHDQYNASTSSLVAASNYEAGIDNLTTALHDNGVTVDITDEKGRKNVATILQTGDAIATMIQRRFDETHSVADATAAGEMYVANLEGQLRAAGLNDDQIHTMIDTMNLTPEKIDTIFSNNAIAQQVVVGKYLTMLKDIPPEQQTKIEALIAQGSYDGANALLNELAHPRSVDFHITTSGSVLVPDLGPAANREFHGVGKNAGGTANWRGGATWVGEGGPEIVELPQGSRVHTASASSDIAATLDRLASSLVPVQVAMSGPGVDAAYARAIAREVVEQRWRFGR